MTLFIDRIKSAGIQMNIPVKNEKDKILKKLLRKGRENDKNRMDNR
jgi:hypothetical protein